MRYDVTVSVCPRGQQESGTKVKEIFSAYSGKFFYLSFWNVAGSVHEVWCKCLRASKRPTGIWDKGGGEEHELLFSYAESHWFRDWQTGTVSDHTCQSCCRQAERFQFVLSGLAFGCFSFCIMWTCMMAAEMSCFCWGQAFQPCCGQVELLSTRPAVAAMHACCFLFCNQACGQQNLRECMSKPVIVRQKLCQVAYHLQYCVLFIFAFGEDAWWQQSDFAFSCCLIACCITSLDPSCMQVLGLGFWQGISGCQAMRWKQVGHHHLLFLLCWLGWLKVAVVMR